MARRSTIASMRPITPTRPIAISRTGMTTIIVTTMTMTMPMARSTAILMSTATIMSMTMPAEAITRMRMGQFRAKWSRSRRVFSPRTTRWPPRTGPGSVGRGNLWRSISSALPRAPARTTLLERTIRDLEDEQENCSSSSRAIRRPPTMASVSAAAGPAGVVQVNTGAGCHLEVDMVARGLQELRPSAGSVVMIENVGNLVCPALFDLGERAKVVILSVAEGEDKPLKYPHMFRAAEIMILNKIDLLPHVDFDMARAVANAIQGKILTSPRYRSPRAPAWDWKRGTNGSAGNSPPSAPPRLLDRPRVGGEAAFARKARTLRPTRKRSPSGSICLHASGRRPC